MRRWLALLVLVAIGCMADDEMPCTIHHDGRYYDLNPLKANKDYEFKTPGDNLFVINICQRPLRETFGLKDVGEAEVGGFVRRAHGDFSIGTLTTNLSMQGSNPHITLRDGSRCKSKSGDNHIRASTAIEFVCDTTVSGQGAPRLVAQLPPDDEEEACAFFLEWRTPAACSTSEPAGVWGFFSFITFLLMSLALLYLVAGVLYNRFVLQLRGVDQIPKFSFLSMRYHAAEALDWIKDLISGSHRSNSGYASMPSGDISAPLSGTTRPRSAPNTGSLNPVSHQTQVLSASNEADSGFPQPRLSPSAGRQADINPVSHQAQISAQLSPSQSTVENSPLPPAPIPEPTNKQRKRPHPFDLESQTPKREFSVGEDDDDDDLGSAQTAAVPPRVVSGPVQPGGPASGGPA